MIGFENHSRAAKLNFLRNSKLRRGFPVTESAYDGMLSTKMQYRWYSECLYFDICTRPLRKRMGVFFIHKPILVRPVRAVDVILDVAKFENL